MNWFNAEQNSVYAVSLLRLDQQEIPASDYKSAREFSNAVIADGNQKLILSKAD